MGYACVAGQRLARRGSWRKAGAGLGLTGHIHKARPTCPPAGSAAAMDGEVTWGRSLGTAAASVCLPANPGLGAWNHQAVHRSLFANHRRAWTGGPPTPSPPARCLLCATHLRITLCWICTQMAASGKWAMCAVPAAVGVSAGTFLWGPSRLHFQLASAVISRSHHLVPQSPRPLTPPPLQLERLGQEPGRRALQRLVDIFWRRRAAAGRDGGE